MKQTPTVLIQTAPADGSGPDVIELIIALLSFLGIVAWPVALCLVLWWFREPLKAKINEATTLEGFGVKLLLADALGRAKAIKGNADVQEQPDTLEATGTVDLRADDLATERPTLGTAVIDITPPSFERIAAVVPSTAILYQWGKIEERLIELADTYHLPINRRGGGPLIEFLDAADILPRRLTSLIRDLYSVRNSAAHPGAKIDFSRDEALKFRDASEIVLKELDELVTQGVSRKPMA